MEKEQKYAAKLARLSAAQQKKQQEQKMAKEMVETLNKIEELEKAKIDEKRQQRELEKKLLKKERKALRDFTKSHNYFARNASQNLKNMQTVEKICEIFSLNDLKEINQNLTNSANCEEEFVKLIKQVKNLSMNGDRSEVILNNSSNNDSNSKKSLDWNNDQIALLIKAVNLFPAGTNNRWEVIANFMNQHAKNLDVQFQAKDVLAKTKDLQQMDFSKTSLKTEINQASFQNSSKNSVVVPTDDMDTSVMITDDKAWSTNEQQLLEQALKTFPASVTNRWDKIAECVQTRSKKDCIKRYKELVEAVKLKKASLIN